MSALIAWICRLDHREKERSADLPNLTLHNGQWAYCPQGGDRDHKWNAIEPAPLEMLGVRRHASEVAPMEAAK